jgi:hypothetical protein
MYGDIGEQLFSAWFDFGRPNAAPFRNQFGQRVNAEPNLPRFDHDEGGTPIGLLIGPGPELGQSDRARLQLDAIGATKATVLHAIRENSGVIVRRAWYSIDPQATIDACLSQAGHHFSVGAVPGYRPNLGGFIRYRGANWLLTGVIGTGNQRQALGDDDGRALIGA